FPCATGDCEDTGREEKRLSSLLNELVAWNEYSTKPEVELLWLYSGDEITSADSLDEYSWLHLIADKSAVELYSTPLSNGMFMISKDGRIAYLDDYVVQAGDGSIPVYPVFRIPTFGMTGSKWFREFVYND
ncbi:MAG: peroxiredoxin, partial [Mesotoga sp.]|nr:peroxiredoxin [Mesotoga sp.]